MGIVSGFYRVFGCVCLIIAVSYVAACSRSSGGYQKPKDHSNNPPKQQTPDPSEKIAVQSVQLLSASADGSEADVRVLVETEIGANEQAYLQLDIMGGNLSSPIHYNAGLVDGGMNTHSFDLVVPFVSSISGQFSARAYLSKEPMADYSANLDQSTQNFTLGFPAGLTSLDDVASVDLQVIPGSYSSALINENGIQRRVHYFSAQVFDQNNVSISGLDTDTQKYFRAYEDGNFDVESGVTVDSRQNQIRVYLIIDVSSSITQADAVEALREAAAQTVLSLSSFSSFNYREFSGNVRKLSNLRELNFEENISATALYRSVDSALSDIEMDASEEDIVVVAFTDGIDLASRNFYPELGSHNEVRDLVAERIQNLKSTRAAGSLITHFVGLGSNVDEQALNVLATAGGGQYLIADDKDSLNAVFLSLSNLIKSTYRLEYSSQQIPEDTVLELEVDINGVIDREVVKGE